MLQTPDHAALFVGGPWDGQMRAMEVMCPTYTVAVRTLAYPYGLQKDGQDVVDESHPHVNYKHLKVAERHFYLAELDGWEARDYQKHPYERLMHMLSQGYRRI